MKRFNKSFRCAVVALACVALLAVCMAIGAVRNANIPQEKFLDVDVDGHKLHMLIAGESGPIVVLESGLPGGLGWQEVRQEVGRFATVVTYDRAGIGQSEPGPHPRDARQIATELHTALHTAGLRPPYVLVGHSMGGPYIRVFAAKYPEEVSGLILVDPSQAEIYEPMDDLRAWFSAHHPQDWSRVQAVGKKMAKGLERGMVSGIKRIEEFLETLPDSRRQAITNEFWSTFENVPEENISPQLSPGAHDECEVVVDTYRQAVEAQPLPKVPTVLIAAGQPMLYLEVTATLSPNMRLLHQMATSWKLADFQKWIDATPGANMIVAKRTGHNIPTENPQLVIDVVRHVVQQAAGNSGS
jgi:pimeloyl-ACP methyl ester carboxylesterase